jgi:mannosyl-glycoprotein endo-beta-N-acetylglucosaminidase
MFPLSVSAQTSYTVGDSHEDISTYKVYLNRIGFDGILVTDYFGNYTASRIKDFQKYYGLSMSGKLDDATRNKLDEVYHTSLQRGKTDERLSALKETLNQYGYGPILVTDYFGGYMESQVKQFQQEHGLVVNGIMDSRTLDMLSQVTNPPYKSGDYSHNLSKIKQDLNKLGYNGILVTPNFGSYFESKVKAFQKANDLTADGIIGNQTLTRIEETLKSPYRQGQTNTGLSELKRQLNALGYGPITVTNYFGSYMETQIKSFQRNEGLAVNGLIDYPTEKRINERFNLPYKQGERHSELLSIKRQMNQLGFGNTLVTNFFGNYFESQVNNFKKTYGLSVNGEIDQEMVTLLNNIINSPLQEGKTHNSLSTYKEQLNTIGYGPIIVTDYFGAYMTSQVKQFQRDNNLPEHGILDETTLSILKQRYEPPYYIGETHRDLIGIKTKLRRLGFANLTSTALFDRGLENSVKEFQRIYGITSNGVVDTNTLNKIDEVLNLPLQLGKSSTELPEIKNQLNTFGYGPILETTYFGSYMQSQVKAFQQDYGLLAHGIIDEPTRAKISDMFAPPYKVGDRHQEIIPLKRSLNQLGYGPILETNLFGSYTQTELKAFQKNSGLSVTGMFDNATIAALQSFVIRTNYSKYHKDFETYVDSLMKLTPKADGQGLIDAQRPLVEYYANPNNFPVGSEGYLQFKLLDASTGISGTRLNSLFLNGKGTLSGTGNDFARAGKDFGIDEVYLISHALHETGNGGSALARGVYVDKNGYPTYIDKNNNGEKDDDEPYQETKDSVAKVYNMYGVGANDGYAIQNGARYAYDKGWTTPGKAVYGGAEFIYNRYLKAGRNTLYKMKWNPDGTGAGHYATHVAWAVLQTKNMNTAYDNLSDFNIKIDLPVFDKMPDYVGPTPPDNKPGDSTTVPDGQVVKLPAQTIGRTTSNLNFRSAPNTNSSTTIYGVIPNGTNITVLESNGQGWIKVNYNGRDGWVSKSYVTYQNLFTVTTSTSPTLNVRKEPKTSSDRVGQVNKGQYITVMMSNGSLITSNNWYQIYYNDASDGTKQGWVSGDYVTQMR